MSTPSAGLEIMVGPPIPWPGSACATGRIETGGPVKVTTKSPNI